MILSPPDFIADMSSLLAGRLSQHARLLTLSTAQGVDLPDSLVVERFSGTEGINDLYRFDIDTLSLSTDLKLTRFVGTEVTLRLLQANGTRRAWHGYCTDAAWLGADGGVARYRLRMEPFLSALHRRRDNIVFQDQTATEIITTLLADYPQANFRFDVNLPLVKHAVYTQYRETDLAFFRRLLAGEGLSWRFTHVQGSTTDDAAGSAQAKHQLVIFDRAAAAPITPGGYDTIRFHRVAATEFADAITDFAASRQVQANATAVSCWHPEQLLAPAADVNANVDAGGLPSLAIFSGSGERQFADVAAAEQYTERMLQSLEMGNKIFRGRGAVRQLAAGHTFELRQHDRYDDQTKFTVLHVSHTAVNNFNTGIAALIAPSQEPAVAGAVDANLSAAAESGTYRNAFLCIPQTVPIVTRDTARAQAPTIYGALSAIVVGLADAVVTTDRDYRVKIQFNWQRGQAPNSGGRTDTGNLVDTIGSAPGDETSGTWVRVAEALSGPNWGTQFTPRIGCEVLVDFTEGDVDRPVIVAQLYNGADTPPWSAGVDAGSNHAGVLGGWHSSGFDRAGFNQWQIDDSAAQLRMRVATSTAASQVNLGYLIAQSPCSAQRGGYRGHGFELRSDAWGAVRAGDGMLLSTTTRARSGTSVASTQMDAAEALAQLRGAEALIKAVSNGATQQTALSSTDALQAQSDLIGLIDPNIKGKHSVGVNDHAALKARDGSRELDPANLVECFGAPIVLIESPSTINWAGPASTALFAGQQLQWTSQADIHLAARETITSASGQAATLFSHAGGVQIIAGNGAVSLQAHTAALEVLADKAVTLVSVSDGIEIKAQQKVTLQAGQSGVTLEGGNIGLFCPGTFSVKGAAHPFSKGSGNAPMLGKLPDRVVPAHAPAQPLFVKYDQQIVYKDPHGTPIAQIPLQVLNKADLTQKIIHPSPRDGVLERLDTAQPQPLEYALRYAKFNFKQ